MKKTDEWQESGICNGGRTNGVCQEVWTLLGPGCGCLSSGRFTMRRRWQKLRQRRWESEAFLLRISKKPAHQSRRGTVRWLQNSTIHL